jgi:hypothetical protein
VNTTSAPAWWIAASGTATLERSVAIPAQACRATATTSAFDQIDAVLETRDA